MKSIKRYAQQRQLTPRIATPPMPSLRLICVIPCLNEPAMLATLQHLYHCDMPDAAIEIIVVINHAKNHPATIKQCNIQTAEHIIAATKQWHDHCRCHIITAFDLPSKKSGVGVARKIGMDEAMLRLAAVNTPDGLIVCLDADCQVDQHYFTSLLRYAAANPLQHAMLCDFHHPLDSGMSKQHQQAMTAYELLLRTIALGWAYAGLPYAFIAIGSCMVVRANAYARHQGMNTRQAGEDFYFMHKLARERSIKTLQHIRVYPSARISTRTPFGTGQAMQSMCQGDAQQQMMVNPQVFEHLKQMVQSLPALYASNDAPSWLASLHSSLALSLKQQGIVQALAHMHGNAASSDTFCKHFFTWFDGLKAWRIVHQYREQDAMPITEAAQALTALIERIQH